MQVNFLMAGCCLEHYNPETGACSVCHFCYSQAAWTAYLLRIAEASAPIRETQAQAEAARPISETQIETPTFSRSCHAAQGCRQSDCGRPAFALAATWSLRTDARPLSSARLRAESQPTANARPESWTVHAVASRRKTASSRSTRAPRKSPLTVSFPIVTDCFS